MHLGSVSISRFATASSKPRGELPRFRNSRIPIRGSNCSTPVGFVRRPVEEVDPVDRDEFRNPCETRRGLDCRCSRALFYSDVQNVFGCSGCQTRTGSSIVIVASTAPLHVCSTRASTSPTIGFVSFTTFSRSPSCSKKQNRGVSRSSVIPSFSTKSVARSASLAA